MDLQRELGDGLTGIDGAELDPGRIDTLQEMLNQTLEMSPVSLYRLRSRKNIVVHFAFENTIIPDLVAKLFVTDHYEKELALLQQTRENSLPVPEVVDARDGVILMKYISGELLVDVINRTFDEPLIVQLADWYYNFHDITGMTKGDPRLRNFILNDDTLVGLDFEEASTGLWMPDIAGIAASLLDTNPIFDIRKRKLVWFFFSSYLRNYGITRNVFTDRSFTQAVSDILERTASLREDYRIHKIAKQVRQQGIPVD